MDLSEYLSHAAGSPPAAPGAPSVGYPTGGNPGTGAPATAPGPFWFFQLQSEMAALIAAAGLTPDSSVLTQLRDAVLSFSSRPGEVIWFAATSAPAGTLAANGAAVSVATYGRLAAVIYCGDSANATADWGYRCTGSDGSGRSTSGAYIVLPDLRGEFPRGWDAGRGADTGRQLHFVQAGANAAHSHSYGFTSALSVAVSVSYDVPYVVNALGAAGGGSSVYVPGLTSAAATGTGSGTLTVAETTASSGSEARPRNVALLACIVV